MMIGRIRDASRRLVRELGFMEATLAGADLTPSAVHAIIEVGSGRTTNARGLTQTLRLEKSTVSRLLKNLIADGYLTEQRDDCDTRMKRLALTERGQASLAGITDYAVDQVTEAISSLSAKDVATIAKGLEIYAAALGSTDHASETKATISEGYRPGIIGRMLQMHAEYYARTVGFGAAFETGLATDMGAFFSRLENEENGFWVAEIDGRPVGTIAIDGEDLGQGIAHLRWFITAEDLQGQGIGKRLIDTALRFVDSRSMRETRLWTFQGLDAAKHLYERVGFELVEEKPGQQWGSEVLEQQFLRVSPLQA
ncbi:MarR family transcriptional regulator [Kaustia mangrovi]|uniref:MarR family transcriptional regulator n=2 Tax=Kaustia mangrovi TaxID=2593653 RepID=A0A7S8HEC7_9HYPH|nr:MarR family transcriptional regulator [Kaustia mangrovi]